MFYHHHNHHYCKNRNRPEERHQVLEDNHNNYLFHNHMRHQYLQQVFKPFPLKLYLRHCHTWQTPRQLLSHQHPSIPGQVMEILK